jgi:hypothetical protein
MFGFVALYGMAALVREAFVVTYYRSISSRRAGWAATVGSVISFMDLAVLVSLVSLMRDGGKGFVPAVAYIVCGGIGTYLGVRKGT